VIIPDGSGEAFIQEQALRGKLRAALKEQRDAWMPIIRKQGALALGLTSDGPAPDEWVRLRVATRRADDAAKALEDFITGRNG